MWVRLWVLLWVLLAAPYTARHSRRAPPRDALHDRPRPGPDATVGPDEEQLHRTLDLDDSLVAPRAACTDEQRAAIAPRVFRSEVRRRPLGGDRELLSGGEGCGVGGGLRPGGCIQSPQHVDEGEHDDQRERNERDAENGHRPTLVPRQSVTLGGTARGRRHALLLQISCRIVAAADSSTADGKSQRTRGMTTGAR